MPTLNLTDYRTDGAQTPRQSAADVYLTDGVFLYRVLAVSSREADPIVALEDCYGLDVVEIPIDELRDRRLRGVTPAILSDVQAMSARVAGAAVSRAPRPASSPFA